MKVNAPMIYAAMIEADMGVRELCNRAGMSHDTVKKVLDGKLVRLDAMRRLLDALGLKAAEIIQWEGDAHGSTSYQKARPVKLVHQRRRAAN